MSVYYLNLALILGLAYPLCIYKPNRYKKLAYLIVTFGYMWFLATFRYGIGFDYFSYMTIYAEAQELSFGQLFSTQYEFGFMILTKIMTLFIQSDVAMYGVYSFLILAPMVWFIYRHCDDAWLSTWLYVTLAFFYTNMNFIRQSLACSIVVLGYGFMQKKKLVPFLAVVLVAATFHKTALVMIPIYLLSYIKLDKKMAAVYAGATVVFYLTSSLILDVVTNYVFKYYKGTMYIDQGFPIYFLLVPLVVLGTCLALYPTWKKRDPNAQLLLYCAMFSFIIWVFITKHFILERFSMHVYIFMLVAVPSALSSLKADPETYRQLMDLKLEQKGKGSKNKESSHKLRSLNQTVKDHQKYYWSAVAGILLVTLIYNDFGANVNNFHNVFPYQTLLEWLRPLV